MRSGAAALRAKAPSKPLALALALALAPASSPATARVEFPGVSLQDPIATGEFSDFGGATADLVSGDLRVAARSFAGGVNLGGLQVLAGIVDSPSTASLFLQPPPGATLSVGAGTPVGWIRPVPEPAVAGLMLAGLVVLGCRRRPHPRAA